MKTQTRQLYFTGRFAAGSVVVLASPHFGEGARRHVGIVSSLSAILSVTFFLNSARAQTNDETSAPKARDEDAEAQVIPDAQAESVAEAPTVEAETPTPAPAGPKTAGAGNQSVSNSELGKSPQASDAQDDDFSAGLDDVSLVDLLQLDLKIATTKTNTTVQASPAAVTIITREDIERYGYRSIADALRDVVGTYAVDDHITPNLGVRGVPGTAYEGSGAIKVMIDGVSVAFRTTGENWLGPALVPMSSVERIEIIKGPTSSLYGADAFLGVINVITKEAGQKNWGEAGLTGMATYAGKPGAHVETSMGLVNRPLRLTLGAQFDQEDRSGLKMPDSSPAPSLATSSTDVSRGQVLRSGVAIFNLSHTPTRKTIFSLSGRYAQQRSAAEFAPWLQFTTIPGQEAGTKLALQQGNLTLKAGSDLSHKFRLEATSTGFFGGTLPGDRIETGDTVAVVHRELSYVGGEGTVEGIWQPVDPLRFVLGVEGSVDHEHLGAPDYRDRQDGTDLPSAGTAEDFETNLFNVAGRAQGTWTIIQDYLVPTVGVRMDHNSVYGNRVSGRVAVVSRVHPDLYLKGSYGTAFKAATPLLLYGRPITIGDVIGSPKLGPQEIRSLDFTADYRRKSIIDVEVTFSLWDLIDRAVFQPEQINLVATNAADATGWTVEAQAKSNFSEHIGASLGFEWVEAVRQSGEVGYRGQLFGTAQAIYPQFIARGRVWVQPKPTPLEFWLASNIVGQRSASDSNTLEAAERYNLPTYATLDLGIRTVNLHWLGQRLTEFSLRGQNVLNTAGASAGFFGIDYPAAPPKVLIEVRQEM